MKNFWYFSGSFLAFTASYTEAIPLSAKGLLLKKAKYAADHGHAEPYMSSRLTSVDLSFGLFHQARILHALSANVPERKAKMLSQMGAPHGHVLTVNYALARPCPL